MTVFYERFERHAHGEGLKGRSTHYCPGCGHGLVHKYLADAIEASGEAGLLFVAAAGNHGGDNDTSFFYPASYPSDNIISVAATDHNDALAGFSAYGATTVDVAAPGVDVWSTFLGSTYAFLSGTSMATPHVAGVATLAWSTSPGSSYQQVRDAWIGVRTPDGR